jgi:hypothetical protein
MEAVRIFEAAVPDSLNLALTWFNLAAQYTFQWDLEPGRPVPCQGPRRDRRPGPGGRGLPWPR